MAQLPTTSAPASTPAHKDRFIRHANLMSILTILSRIFGLVRDKLWSSYLGLGSEFAAFWMGFQLPNLFRRIFGEGALTAIFVPIYTRIRNEEGQEAANRLAAATCTLLVTVLGGLTIVGELIVIPLAFSPHVMANNQLAAAMVAIMLPYCVLVCVVALFGAIASVHERFTAQSLSPIILNVLTAAAAVLPVILWTRDYPLRSRVFWVAGAVIAAGVLQVLQMLPTLRRSGVRLGVLFDGTSGIRDIITAMLPMILGFSAVQFNTFMDGQIAYWLSPDGHGGARQFAFLGWQITTPMDVGALAKLSVGQRIYLLPVGIFGVSMATALFPQFSRAAAVNDLPELKRLLAAGLRKTLFLSLPASAGMILVAKPLISLIYIGRQTTLDDIDRATWVALWFCAGIWAFEAQLVILRVFYALRDTRTPMLLALLMVLLNFALNLTLVWFMREGGLAASTTISAIVQSGLLLLILHRRLGPLGLGALRKSIFKGLAASAVMVLGAGAAAAWLGRLHWVADPKADRLIGSAVYLPTVVLLAVGVYGACAYLLKMPELADVPVVGRWFRKR